MLSPGPGGGGKGKGKGKGKGDKDKDDKGHESPTEWRMAASIVDASSMEWPTWGPSRDDSCCLVCGLCPDACVCSTRLKGYLEAAFGDDTVAASMLYFDRLLNKKTTWVRAALVSECADRELRATCWICKKFLHRAPHGPSKLAREGLPVAGLQKGQFRDHWGRASHNMSSDHQIGLDNYSRMCSQWLRQHGPEDLVLRRLRRRIQC